MTGHLWRVVLLTVTLFVFSSFHVDASREYHSTDGDRMREYAEFPRRKEALTARDEDYPHLKSIPHTSFSCDSVPWRGYYADVEAGCQVFHYCPGSSNRVPKRWRREAVEDESDENGKKINNQSKQFGQKIKRKKRPTDISALKKNRPTNASARRSSGPTNDSTRRPNGPIDASARGSSGPTNDSTRRPNGPTDFSARRPNGPTEASARRPNGPTDFSAQRPNGPTDDSDQRSKKPTDRRPNLTIGTSNRRNKKPKENLARRNSRLKEASFRRNTRRIDGPVRRNKRQKEASVRRNTRPTDSSARRKRKISSSSKTSRLRNPQKLRVRNEKPFPDEFKTESKEIELNLFGEEFGLSGSQRNFSFLCPVGTVFHQSYFICVWWYDFECEQALGLYETNRFVFGNEGDLHDVENVEDYRTAARETNYNHNIHRSESLSRTNHKSYKQSNKPDGKRRNEAATSFQSFKMGGSIEMDSKDESSSRFSDNFKPRERSSHRFRMRKVKSYQQDSPVEYSYLGDRTLKNQQPSFESIEEKDMNSLRHTEEENEYSWKPLSMPSFKNERESFLKDSSPNPFTITESELRDLIDAKNVAPGFFQELNIKKTDSKPISISNFDMNEKNKEIGPFHRNEKKLRENVKADDIVQGKTRIQALTAEQFERLQRGENPFSEHKVMQLNTQGANTNAKKARVILRNVPSTLHNSLIGNKFPNFQQNANEPIIKYKNSLIINEQSRKKENKQGNSHQILQFSPSNERSTPKNSPPRTGSPFPVLPNSVMASKLKGNNYETLNPLNAQSILQGANLPNNILSAVGKNGNTIVKSNNDTIVLFVGSDFNSQSKDNEEIMSNIMKQISKGISKGKNIMHMRRELSSNSDIQLIESPARPSVHQNDKLKGGSLNQFSKNSGNNFQSSSYKPPANHFPLEYQLDASQRQPRSPNPNFSNFGYGPTGKQPNEMNAFQQPISTPRNNFVNPYYMHSSNPGLENLNNDMNSKKIVKLMPAFSAKLPDSNREFRQPFSPNLNQRFVQRRSGHIDSITNQHGKHFSQDRSLKKDKHTQHIQKEAQVRRMDVAPNHQEERHTSGNVREGERFERTVGRYHSNHKMTNNKPFAKRRENNVKSRLPAMKQPRNRNNENRKRKDSYSKSSKRRNPLVKEGTKYKSPSVKVSLSSRFLK